MKTLRHFILALAVTVCGNIFAQKSQQDLKRLMLERNEYYFTFELNGHDNLKAIAQAISVDRVDGKTVTAYANNDEFAKFEQFGYALTLQTPPSMLYEATMWDGTDRANYDWDSYPTYEAYEAMMFQFAADHPDKCEIITLGTLPSGRKILIAHLNNGIANGKPKFLYTSTIHGDETTGWILMLRLIDYLLENPNAPEVQTVMENIDLYIGPNTNPDGTYRRGNNTVNGATRENANGIDMNRNYPDPHGSAHPDGNAYQTETQWFMQFAQDIPFTMGGNFHGGAEVMNYPWDNSYTLHADDNWWQMVCREYADDCHKVNPNYMTDLIDGITNGAQWYMIGGGRQDYMNGYAQCREVTIECSNTKLPAGNQLPNFWNYNKDALFDYMNQCLYGVHGVVIDSLTRQPIEATITVSGHDNEFSLVKSHLPAGDFHRPIKSGRYTIIVSKDGYCPKSFDVNVDDYESIHLDVQLVPGECILADFNASATQLALGQRINFTDNSFGAVTSWRWTFEGGQPSTSTQQNPTGIMYATAGDFDVILTIGDAQGNSMTITRNDYIQVRESYNMQNTTITTCSAMFYDDGGPNNSYGNNKNYTMTFLPDGASRKISADFLTFSTEEGYDYLYIYDGGSVNSPLIGQYHGSNSPGSIRATNNEGALTFRFVSDRGTVSLGWSAVIQCVEGETLTINVQASPETIDYGQQSRLSVNVIGGDGNYSYSWTPAETLNNPTIASPVATPNAPESHYKVRVTDGQGITGTGEVTVYIRNWSVDEISSTPCIYPNPNNGTFTIETDGIFNYSILNNMGQRIMTGKANGKTLIDGNSLSQGIYFLHLIGEGAIRVEKLVIEK